MTLGRIAAVRARRLAAPTGPHGGADDDPAREALIVEVESQSGLIGLGECNHHPAAALAFFAAPGASRTEAGVKVVTIGRDVRDRAAIWSDLLEANLFSAARGIGRGVLAAIDMALWDLAAQVEGVPLWQLLWGDAAVPPRAYATLYTGAGDLEQSRARLRPMIEHARASGFRAIKVEPLSDCVPTEAIGPFVAEARHLAGADLELLVDFGYRFHRAQEAIDAIRACLPASPLLVETPCALSDLSAWRSVARHVPLPLAGAELADHPLELIALAEAGATWLQPWANRLGITGTLELFGEARARGCRLLMAGWNATAVGNAASLHLAAGIGGPGPHLEHADPQIHDFPLSGACGPASKRDGDTFPLPRAAGLGVSLEAGRSATLTLSVVD